MFNRLKTSLLLIWLPLLPFIAQAAIVKGPYLVHPEQTSMKVMWESDVSEEATICYGEKVDLNQSLTILPLDEKNKLYLYQAHIKNLLPGHKYFYQVVMTDDVSEVSYFYTKPSITSPISFVAAGDSRTGHETHRRISDAIINLAPDFAISMGDLVEKGGAFDQWGPHFFEPAANLIDHIPLISTFGDHDNEVDNGENFHYYLRSSRSNEKLWFSFDYGPAHFVSLDYRGENNQEMMEWFEKDMAATQAKWKFVYLHRPSYNIGGHRTNWGGPVWPELYRKHEVDIVFAGHSHIYERFYPMRPFDEPEAWPVTYVTTGGAGAGLYESVKHEYLAATQSINHFILINLTTDSLQFTAMLPDMSILDKFIVIKRNGRYDASYLDLVKPQEKMDVHMIFAKELLLRFDQLPSKTKPAIKNLGFQSQGIDEDINFKVLLSQESANNYWIEPFEGVLKKGQVYEGMVKLYAKEPVSIDRRYFVPPVFFDAYYQTSFVSGIARGRQSRYYPPDINKSQ